MSRSRKKTPVCGITRAESEKDYKRIRAGAERAKERALTQKASLGDEIAAESLEVEKVPYDDAVADKDGKQWIGSIGDVEYKRKLMRK